MTCSATSSSAVVSRGVDAGAAGLRGGQTLQQQHPAAFTGQDALPADVERSAAVGRDRAEPVEGGEGLAADCVGAAAQGELGVPEPDRVQAVADGVIARRAGRPHRDHLGVGQGEFPGNRHGQPR
jgi:hypothetical protein